MRRFFDPQNGIEYRKRYAPRCRRCGRRATRCSQRCKSLGRAKAQLMMQVRSLQRVEAVL